MGARYPTKVLLAMKSGDRCAMEKCRAFLSSKEDPANPVVLGEAAHIYGENPTAARYKPDMTEDDRNHYDNLIYLCPTCHTKIDKQEEKYPFELLFEIKRKHEAWVSEQLDDGMSVMTFAELEIAAKALVTGNHAPNGDFTVIPPEEKIKKNLLTDQIRVLISSGLSRSHEVREYLYKQSQLDADFPECLKEGFRTKYAEMKKNSAGDALFMAMFDFAKGGRKDFPQQAASLAILCHLFELCEVFEK